MGTRAAFAVASKDGDYFKRIIAMTCDGFPKHLKSLAAEFMEIAHDNDLMSKITARDPGAVKTVQDLLVERHPLWLFIDSVNNASSASYSCVLDTKKGELEIYDGLFEHYPETFDVKQETVFSIIKKETVSS